MNVYFDNAATTPMRKEVIDSISSVMNDSFGNPSSTHSYGRSAKSFIETSRKSIAKIFVIIPPNGRPRSVLGWIPAIEGLLFGNDLPPPGNGCEIGILRED